MKQTITREVCVCPICNARHNKKIRRKNEDIIEDGLITNNI